MSKFVVLFTLSFFYFQLNCSTEPEADLKLFIENGYYSKIDTSDGKTKYAVDFDYCVTSEKCYVGGYGLNWNEESSSGVLWYSMMKLEPGISYSISDTFRLSDISPRDPFVSMQGYLEILTEADSRLKVEYRLKSR